MVEKHHSGEGYMKISVTHYTRKSWICLCFWIHGRLLTELITGRCSKSCWRLCALYFFCKTSLGNKCLWLGGEYVLWYLLGVYWSQTKWCHAHFPFIVHTDNYYLSKSTGCWSTGCSKNTWTNLVVIIISDHKWHWYPLFYMKQELIKKLYEFL